MRVVRRLPLGLAFALLLLVLSDARVWEGSPGLVAADTWECIEYDTDYSKLCLPNTTRCGSFCFYAECLECTDGYHEHPHEHCSTCCDADGKNCTSCCSTHMHSERHGISPCKVEEGKVNWRWHLLGEGPAPSKKPLLGPEPPITRVDVYNSHNLEASLEFGMVPEGYTPSYPPCMVIVGSGQDKVLPTPIRPPPVPDDRWVGGLSDGTPTPFPFRFPLTEVPYQFTGDVDHGTGRVLDSRAADLNPSSLTVGSLVPYPADVSMGDLSHLPSTPGEPDAPSLDSVTKVVGYDSLVKLQVSGWGVGAREYRYWSYNGLRQEVEGMECRRRFASWSKSCEEGLKAQIEGRNFRGFLEASPSEFRVPFEELVGDLVSVVDGLRGIVSFQVRSFDPNGDLPPPNSNIEHQMVGMKGFHSIGPSWFERLDAPPWPARLDAPPWPARRTGPAMEIPLPTPPPTDVPLPTLEVGVRPVRPAIDSVVQIQVIPVGVVPVERVPVDVEVRLAARYSGRVEYRWWPHSGFGPTAAFEVWCSADVQNDGSFRVSDVEPKTPGIVWFELPDPEDPLWAPFRALLDFQVRLIDSRGVPGDPSEAFVLLIWGGDYTKYSPYPVTPTPAPTVVVPVLTVPVPYTTPRAPGSC